MSESTEPVPEAQPPQKPAEASSRLAAYMPAPTAEDRLRALRSVIVALVIMWVVLVAGWAITRAIDAWRDGQRLRAAQGARLQLASVAELSSVFTTVNESLEPSVVKIDVRRPAPPSSGPGGGEPQAAPRQSPFGMETPEANSGSGVIVEVDAGENGGSEVGYVVTNHHVVVGAGDNIAVTLADGRRVPARTLGTDPQSDLAVLRIESRGLVPAEWGDSDTLRKGDWVLAFGSPFGFVGSMTAGVVSALNRTQTDGVTGPLQDAGYQHFIQVDAAINPGNSGGPLVDVSGRVIGINSAIFTRTGDFSGIGFAIPSNQARRVYEDIRTQGRVIRGWIGLDVASVKANPEVAEELGYDATSPDSAGGVLVTEVWQDTPAAAAGLRRGDIITRIDGTPVDDSIGVRNKVAFTRPGTTLELDVFRGDEVVSVPLEVGVQPDGILNFRDGNQPLGAARTLATYGLTLAEDGGGRRGRGAFAVIDEIAPGGIADRSGLRPGDRILAINGQPVASAGDASGILASLDPRRGIAMQVQTDDRTSTILLRP